MYAFMPEVTIPEFKISNKSHKLLLVGEGEMDNNIMVRGYNCHCKRVCLLMS